MSLRVFQLFSWSGCVSNAPKDSRARTFLVAAATPLKAYSYAYQEKWATGPSDAAGILEIALDPVCPTGERWLWCGCVQRTGIGLLHGDGERMLQANMRVHLAEPHHVEVDIFRSA